jgi:hypothetical protein
MHFRNCCEILSAPAACADFAAVMSAEVMSAMSNDNRAAVSVVVEAPDAFCRLI